MKKISNKEKIMFYSILAEEFQKNQRKIDSRKTTKEDRKKLIERNKEIFEMFGKDEAKGMI